MDIKSAYHSRKECSRGIANPSQTDSERRTIVSPAISCDDRLEGGVVLIRDACFFTTEHSAVDKRSIDSTVGEEGFD